MTKTEGDGDTAAQGGAAYRTFAIIAEEWQLNVDEQMQLLAISDRHLFDDLKARTAAHERVEVPSAILERLGCVLSIYASLRILSLDDRAADWLRGPYHAPPFEGRAALDLMCSDFAELSEVVSFLLAKRQY
ncbi:DUF2384 domain-containing protein [Sphingopyxis sp. SE2]|uniref:antitoxin Xre/MbcA/ParS toxin-binding domain-containing protein n=1 Tax=Sphingopyxis sp. SE2 TaxID=1586240 RepID=UPI0028C01730|nr:antitoxin Xre/MbcA/ParS toxin-binding domain-containing protein [Sphingopyxis sp. SE2]MDT7531326.1 DUF2384 domain-containing protein [Sphingopyxis sp. SE2]